MKKMKMITIGLTSVTLSLSLFSSAFAQTSAEKPGEDVQQDEMLDHAAMHEKHMQQMRAGKMPMMGGCNHMMNNPARQQGSFQQMRPRQGWMGPQSRMPMMDPEMREDRMQMRQQRMMGRDNRHMMRSQMMQMRRQHMQKMEQRLENIEKMLTELVELQKQP